MGITFMILPKLQFCPRAPQLQEILRGKRLPAEWGVQCDGWNNKNDTAGKTESLCVVPMIDVRMVASGPCVILRVQDETLCVAGWLHPWLVSPERWIWPVWWKNTSMRNCLHGVRAALNKRVRWKVQVSILGCSWRKWLFFPLYHSAPPCPCLKRAASVLTAELLQTEGLGWEQPGECTLLLKRKMCLDSLPNATSASLCTSVGEAEQQGGEDEPTYPLTVWDPLSPFLYNSCRWIMAGRTSRKPHLQHLGGGTAVSSLWWGEEAPRH